MDDLVAFRTVNSEELDYGFVASASNAMGIKARVMITEEMLPNHAEMEKDLYSEDKFCIICHEPGMTTGDKRMHYLLDHVLVIDAPLADWIAVKEEYGTDADSESESECESKAYGSTYTIPDRAGSTRSSSSNQDSSSDDSYGSGSGDTK